MDTIFFLCSLCALWFKNTSKTFMSFAPFALFVFLFFPCNTQPLNRSYAYA